MKTSVDRSLSELRTELSSGFLWFLSTTLIWQLISWGLTLVTARLLTPRDYGMMALVETILPYLVILSTLKVETWLVQRRNITIEDEDAAQTLLISQGILFGVFAYFSADLIARFYQEPALAAPFKCFALIFPFRALQLIPEARLRRELKFKLLGFTNLYIGAFRGIFQLALVIAGFQYWALVFGALVGEIARTIYLIFTAGTSKRFIFNFTIFSSIWTFGISAAGATIGWIIFSTSDNVVVGRLFGVETLGFYAMAYFLMDLPLSKVNTMIAPLVLPYYVKLRDHPRALRKTFLRSTASLVGIIAPVLTGAFAIAPLALPLLLGEKWRPLVMPFQGLALVGILKSIPVHTGNLLYALEKPNAVLKTSLLPAIVLPPAFLLFGYFGRLNLGNDAGIVGIYLAWLLLYPVVGVHYSVNVACRAGDISIGKFFRKLIPATVGSLAILVTVMATDFLAQSFPPVLRLVIEVVLGALAYPLVIVIMFRRTFLESVVMLRRLRKRKK